MSFLNLAQIVKNFVREDKTELALRSLQEALQNHPFENTIIIRTADLFGLRKEILMGVISTEEISLHKKKINHSLIEIVDYLVTEEIKRTKVFISYNHEPLSNQLAHEIRRELKSLGFSLFMDVEDIPIGADWAKTILSEIISCHYFIALLSEKTNLSEMVIKEVEEAYRLRENTGSPIILPVRVQYPLEKKLNARLNFMLGRIQQLEWDKPDDTPIILNKILNVLYGRSKLTSTTSVDQETLKKFISIDQNTPIPVAPLEIPRGAVRLESKYYIERKGEEDFINQIESPGALLRIRGPRQYGKTSLLTRVIAFAKNKEFEIIIIDFQELDENILSDLNQLLWEFCSYFADEFALEEVLLKYWSKPRAKKQICTSFIEKEVLRQSNMPILLAIDEADRLFKFKEVSSEFFLLLRSWHEKSKVPHKEEWENFRLVLSYSTEAKLAIQDFNASPFNVGDEANLPPFSKEQVVELANRHQIEMEDDYINRLMELLNGQPYLVRRSLYLIAKKDYAPLQLLSSASQHDGPFGDHLKHHLVNVKQFDECVNALKEIVNNDRCKDPLIATRLQAAGLIKGSPPNMIFSNKLYSSYFKDKL